MLYIIEDGDIYISIHAPREGGDGYVTWAGVRRMLFQSTPPARGATAVAPAHRPRRRISIHAPREGGDLRLCR